MDLLIALWLVACMMNFSLDDDRATSLRLQVGERVLTVACAYAPNSSSVYPPFVESFGLVLKCAPTGDSIVQLGDFNAN